MKPGVIPIILYSGIAAFVAGSATVFAPLYWAPLPDGYWNWLEWSCGALMSVGMLLLILAIL